MEKDLIVSLLLDIYGELLTTKQYELLDRYYNLDTSLSEIANEYGTARQTVRDAIVKGKAKLIKFENCLKIYSTKNKLQDIATNGLKNETTAEISRNILDVLEEK